MTVATRVPVVREAFPIKTTFTVFDCATCGVLWAVTDEYDQRRRYDGQAFYCPNGHTQSYSSEYSQLQKQLREAENRARSLSATIDRIAVEKAALEKNNRKLKREQRAAERRVTNGICTHCNRSFANVRRHMQSRHPDLVVTAEQVIVRD